MLLLIDHLALRARNYEYLIRLFQEWEVGVPCRHRAGVPHAAGGARGGRGKVGAPQLLPAVCPSAYSHVCTSVHAPTAEGAGVDRDQAPTRGPRPRRPDASVRTARKRRKRPC